MSTNPMQSRLLGVLGAAALLALGAAAGFWWAQRATHDGAPAAQAPASAAASAGQRKVLYWYDPMSPATRFDKPGKSPFMDMQLIPKYADEDATAGTLRIDPSITQNLGVRLASVTRANLASQVQATGMVTFNDRDVTIVQARSGGFVERVAPLAPGDVVAAGALIAELLVPEWAAVQQEYLALRQVGQEQLADAARERMRLAGMPDSLIQEVANSGQLRTRVAIVTPRGGVVQELGVRAGMTVMGGQTLARINGIGSVWLEVAVPEAQSAAVRIGQRAQVQLPALPGETLQGRVSALLPAANEAARTLRVRIELANPGGRLRPGLSAQVQLAAAGEAAALVVPTEAVIRTGQRALVMLAEEGGRFRPVEVTLGGEVGGQTRINSGLREGQKVVASGQFLIDSEASLKGIVAPAPEAAGSAPPAMAAAPAASALHEAQATVDEVGAREVTLTHGPFSTLNMPGMTMAFPLANEHVAHGVRAGDKVRVLVRQSDAGLIVERIEKQGGGR